MKLKTLETKTIEFQGNQRNYAVVDRDIGATAPKYFMSYNGGNPFISDEVPKEYREPMVFHELTEFELLKCTESKCLKSLKAELERVPEDMMQSYIIFRTEVFESLIGFLEQHEPSSTFIPEAKNSLRHLRNLLIF